MHVFGQISVGLSASHFVGVIQIVPQTCMGFSGWERHFPGQATDWWRAPILTLCCRSSPGRNMPTHLYTTSSRKTAVSFSCLMLFFWSGCLLRRSIRMSGRGSLRSRCWFRTRRPRSSGSSWEDSRRKSRSTYLMTSHPSDLNCTRQAFSLTREQFVCRQYQTVHHTGLETPLSE